MCLYFNNSRYFVYLVYFDKCLLPDMSAEICRESIKKIDILKKNGKAHTKKKKKNYGTYIFRVLKQVHPEMSISKRAMDIMNNLVNDIFEKITSELYRLTSYNKLKIITSKEVQIAVRLLLPEELAKHAIIEGIKAVTKYESSIKV